MCEKIGKIKNVLICIFAFLSGVFLTLFLKKDTKRAAKEIVEQQARKLDIDVKSKEVKKSIKDVKRNIEISKRAQIKEEFMQKYGGGK